jgi:hypothetical protein
MSSLINKTTAQIKAEKIDALQSELQSHVESILSLIYAEQAIMDVFGTGATAALTKYGTLHAAISALNPATSVPVPDLTVFQPQPDGTVLFVAPPEPEIEEAPEP